MFFARKSHFLIIDPASGSATPIYPILEGVVRCWNWRVLLFMLDTCTRNRKEVEDLLSVPFLGEIPLPITQKGKRLWRRKEEEILPQKRSGSSGRIWLYGCGACAACANSLTNYRSGEYAMMQFLLL